MTGYPSFDEAEQAFRESLERQGHPGPIVWIFREDVVRQRHRGFVRLPLPDAQRARVQVEYEQAVERGLGLKPHALARMGSTTLCYLWSPADAMDASYAMSPRGSLHLYTHVPLVEGAGVTHPWKWALIQGWTRLWRKEFWARELPARPP